LTEPDDWIVAEIKTALCRCPTVADVNDTVRHYAHDVLALERSRSQHNRVMATQIKHLAKYIRKGLIAGWYKPAPLTDRK